MNTTTQFIKTLTTYQIVVLGLAWMTPMIFFTVYGVAFQATDGLLTSAYIIAFIAIFFTAYSYSQMVKAFPISGSAYTFTSKAINPHTGFLVGWAVLLDYLFSPVIACLTFGIFLNAEFPSIPIPVWIILLNVILAFVNIKGIKSAAKVSGYSVLIQILFIIFFCILVAKDILNGSGTTAFFSLQPFFSSSTSLPTVFAGAAIICFCFLGFDAVTTMAEETINPQKTIPKAIFIIISIAVILYITISYLTAIAYPSFTFLNPDTASYELIHLVGGNLLSALFIIILIIATFTQGLSSYTSISRFLFALGRESILPNKIFGSLHPKFNTPVNNILITAVFSCLALFISLDTAVTFVSFGALTAFTFVNISVISHYYIKEKRRSFADTFLYFIFPLIGTAFIGWLLTLLEKQTLIIGLVWVGIGILYYSSIRLFRKPFASELSDEKTF